MNLYRTTVGAILALITLSAHADELTPEELQFFEAKIRPVLVKECYGCHSAKAGNIRGGLRLDTKELTLMGGSSGPAIVPGDLDESLLYGAITHDSFEMPPKRQLSPNVIDDFRQWIEMGAPDPRETKVAEIRSTISDEEIALARDSFWAYQAPVAYNPPAVNRSDWPVTDIDHFVLAKLEAAAMEPAADAAPYKILRRICFDLVGLPPTPNQIEHFIRMWKSDPDSAVDHVVDGLLQQPQFGERWGRHWLDVARYAESTGREVNMTFPHAWRYRDYVIDSFNADKPFDRFVQEQIAGDLLPARSDEDWTENLIATTFLAIGPKNVNERNRIQFAADLADEQIDATTRVFLGMSVACARCHDHKFDAIPQTDYYALAGIFRSTTTYFGNPPSRYGVFNGPQTRRASSLLLLPVSDANPIGRRYTSDQVAQMKQEIESTMQEAATDRRNRNPQNSREAQRIRIQRTNRLAQISARLSVVDENGNPRSYCMGVQDNPQAEDVRVLARGEIDEPGQVVSRGFPQVLCNTPTEIDRGSSGRLELARWIGSDQNTLTARVMANRVWKHLLGQGIVRSTENFGVTGQPPSHPELLDFLAVRLIQSGWSIKSLVREITTSRIYRIGSVFDEQNHQRDPENALLWRANPRRLDAESIRDAMLTVSGEIELDRPQGSEVANAGYTRVRGSTLGDPRESLRKARELASQQMRESMRRQFGRRGSGNAGGTRGLPREAGPGQRAGQGPGQRAGQGPGQRLGQGPGQRLGQGPGQRARQSPGQRGGQRAGGGMNRGFRNAPGQNARKAMEQERAAMEARLSEAARKAANQLDMEDAKFRSVYLPVVRDQEPRSLEVFDFADSNAVTGVRELSNTSNQALYMMNNRFVIQQSDAFAKRISQHDGRLEDQVDRAFLMAYGRPPTSGERSASASFMRGFAPTANPAETLSALCQSLFAAAEFRYID